MTPEKTESLDPSLPSSCSGGTKVSFGIDTHPTPSSDTSVSEVRSGDVTGSLSFLS